MQFESELDPQLLQGLANLRPERWGRWIEAGQKGDENRKNLARLVQAKENIRLSPRLSVYVKQLVDACGLSMEDAGNALGISLQEGYGILDLPTYCTLEAADSLELDSEFVRLALQLACFEPAVADDPSVVRPVTQQPKDWLVNDKEMLHKSLASLGVGGYGIDPQSLSSLPLLKTWMTARVSEICMSRAAQEKQFAKVDEVWREFHSVDF